MAEITEITKETVYRTTDGVEFSNKAAAERHEVFIEVKEKYDRARESMKRMIAERCITADGQPFSFTNHGTYYMIRYYGDKPCMYEFDPWVWHIDFSDRDWDSEGMKATFIEDKHGAGKEFLTIRPSEVFAKKENAQRVLVERLREHADAINREADNIEATIRK